MNQQQPTSKTIGLGFFVTYNLSIDMPVIQSWHFYSKEETVISSKQIAAMKETIDSLFAELKDEEVVVKPNE